MVKTDKTHIFCFDDYRSFSEDVKKRFQDTSRYKVVSFQTREELLKHLEADKINPFCKIAILGMHDSKEQISLIDKLTVEIKKIDPKTGIILLIPAEQMAEVTKAVKLNIDAYIPRNTNAILRIHNIVKKLISENTIIRFRKRRNVTLIVLFSFIFAAILFLIFARYRFPQYF
jgi:DNA-binding NarL/FixJ family response regulator